MRVSSKGILIACLLGLVAGCSTVKVSQTAPSQSQAHDDSAQRLAHWQFNAGNRPPADPDGYRPPTRLAVLLPLSGSLSVAAAPVRDGLLAAYYGEQRRRPEIRFYDTFGTAGGAIAAYNKAVADGADQVLGPLGRDGVDAVFRGAQATVPVLALNRGQAAPPPNNASFSLAPEDDGASAADYLASRKAKRILVLSAGDDYARRSVATFTAQLGEDGGQVVQTLAVTGEKPADMTALLQAAAQREGGVDAVFLAMRGPQARAIAAQLVAAGLGGKPRVATSQLTAGTGKASEDRALDGIAFPTERWSVAPVAGLPSADSVGSRLATARGPAAKLFAFGFDAWKLTAYLEHLATSAKANVPGATGVLRIGPAGNVLRSPAWSTFSAGNPVPLGNGG